MHQSIIFSQRRNILLKFINFDQVFQQVHKLKRSEMRTGFFYWIRPNGEIFKICPPSLPLEKKIWRLRNCCERDLWPPTPSYPTCPVHTAGTGVSKGSSGMSPSVHRDFSPAVSRGGCFHLMQGNESLGKSSFETFSHIDKNWVWQASRHLLNETSHWKVSHLNMLT